MLSGMLVPSGSVMRCPENVILSSVIACPPRSRRSCNDVAILALSAVANLLAISPSLWFGAESLPHAAVSGCNGQRSLHLDGDPPVGLPHDGLVVDEFQRVDVDDDDAAGLEVTAAARPSLGSLQRLLPVLRELGVVFDFGCPRPVVVCVRGGAEHRVVGLVPLCEVALGGR